MDFDYSNAKDHLWNYRSCSGYKVEGPGAADWYEVYCHTFCDVLEAAGFDTNEDYCRLLTEMNQSKGCGDLSPDFAPGQSHKAAAYGLIVFDLLLRSEDLPYAPRALFALHQELVECMCYATGYIGYVDSKALARRSISQVAAKARHAKSNAAKVFVQSEWALHRVAYDGNKSAFARHYMGRVKNEFDVFITDKTIREVWLVDTPPAGTQAG